MSFLPTRTPGGKPLILRQLLTSKFPTPPRHTHKIQTSIKGHKAGTVGSAPSTAAFGKRLNYNFLFLGQCWEELRGFRNGFLNHKGDARPLRGKEVARCSLPKYINPKYTNQNVTLQNISPGQSVVLAGRTESWDGTKAHTSPRSRELARPWAAPTPYLCLGTRHPEACGLSLCSCKCTPRQNLQGEDGSSCDSVKGKGFQRETMSLSDTAICLDSRKDSQYFELTKRVQHKPRNARLPTVRLQVGYRHLKGKGSHISTICTSYSIRQRLLWAS